ncbi:MAG: cyclopropane fatty acyl phospholipid synthase [Pseudomonadota bacterium]
MKRSTQAIHSICKKVGIEINGSHPWDLQVKDDRLFDRVIRQGSLGLGEAYMDHWWDAEDVVELFCRLMRNEPAIKVVNANSLFLLLRFAMLNLQRKSRAFNIAEAHYDLGNDLYEATLGPYMQYTCNLWTPETKTIEESEELKLKGICDRLGLKAGDRVLDIGCGWGGFMYYASKNYGVSCVGLSVSAEQKKFAKDFCTGLPVDYVISDYRDYTDKEGFDHIVSIEMIEHVGPKNYRTYFEKVLELLKPSGTFLLQTIGSSHPRPTPGPWINKYIFPDGVVTSIPRLEKAFRGLLVVEELRNIGAHYETTLMSWWNQFDARYQNLKQANARYDERFYRMWKFYLLSCAGMFRSRAVADWQILFSKSPYSGFSKPFGTGYTT